MRPIIRRADASDAQAVHNIMCAIPWISEATKSADGFVKTTETCARGEVFVLVANSVIASIMIFRKNTIAASCGYNIWDIPLIATLETERRKGYARKLVRKAKQVARRAALCAYPENKKSLALLKSEGFVRVQGKKNLSGHPLYERSAS